MKYFTIFSVFVLDRFAKFLVIVNLDYGEDWILLPFLYITRLSNTGVAFSMFTGNNMAFIWINIVIIIFIIFMSLTAEKENKVFVFSYAMILGGALSNLWDRIFYSGVIDYIDLRVWPVFNIADMSISIGAVLLIYAAILEYRSAKAKGA